MNLRDRLDGMARYFRAFFAFLGFGFWTCGAGGVFSMRRSTSSGFGTERLSMVKG